MVNYCSDGLYDPVTERCGICDYPYGSERVVSWVQSAPHSQLPMKYSYGAGIEPRKL